MRENKKDLIIAIVLCVFSTMLSAQTTMKTIKDAIINFDEIVAKKHWINIDVIVPADFTYMDTGTSGSFSGWVKSELEILISSTMHLKLCDTSDLNKETKLAIASRGGLAVNQNLGKKDYYILSGNYYKYGNDYVELQLKINDSNGKLFAAEKAYIPISEIENYGLTLTPQNIETVEAVEKEFNEGIKSKTKRKNDSIAVYAVLLNEEYDMTTEFLRGDKVKFRIGIENDKDAYIAIQCIDVDGNKSWIPVEDNFIEGGTGRVFESYYGDDYVVFQDSLFGAESILIYAAERESDLPKQDGDVSAYKKGDVSKAIGAAKKNCDVFKIVYTIVGE